jgi:hypothetical protein
MLWNNTTQGGPEAQAEANGNLLDSNNRGLWFRSSSRYSTNRTPTRAIRT